MIKYTFLEDKNNDIITKNNYLQNILPIGLLVNEDSAETLYREFEISKLDGNAELILTNRKINNVEKAYTLIIATCLKKLGKLKEADINEEVVRNLTDIDRDYLIMKIRDFTFGDDEPLKASIACDRCGHIEEIENFSLDRLYVNKLENDKEYFKNFKIIKGKVSSPFKFRDTETDTFSVKLPDGRIKEKCAQYLNINIGQWRNKIMQECILQFGEIVNTGFTENELLSLPIPVRKAVWNAIDGVELGFHRKIDFQCTNPNCGKIFNNNVTFENLLPLF